jgi:hypothetical protein
LTPDEIAFVIDDSELHIPTFSPVCSRCRHEFARPHRACAAFPDGIPMRIWLGKNDHSKSYRGDHGIRFAPLRPEDIETLKALPEERPIPTGQSIAELTEQRRRVAS